MSERLPAATVGTRLRSAVTSTMSTGRWFALAVLVGLAARVGALVVFHGGDLYEYGTIAKNLQHGWGYSYFGHANGAFMPPGYTTVVWAALEVGGPHAIALLQVLNLVMFVATCYALHALATRLFGPSVALLTVGLAAILPSSVYQATQTSSANVYLPITVVLAYLLIRRHDGARWYLSAGVLAGVLMLFRSEALIVVGGVVLLDSIRSARTHTIRPIIGRLALLVVGVALVVAPWQIRTSLVLQRPVVTVSTNGWYNVWIGNHAGASGSQKDFSVPVALDRELRAVPPGTHVEDYREQVWRSATTHWVREHPWSFLAGLGKKAALDATYDWHDPRAANPVYLAGWVGLLVLISAAFLRRRRQGDPPMSGAYRIMLAWALLTPVAFFVLARYRLTFEVLVLPYAAVGAESLLAAASIRLRRPSELKATAATPEPR